MDRGTTHSSAEIRVRLRAAAWAATGLLVASGTARVLLQVGTQGVLAPGAARPDDLVLVGLAWLGVALALWLAVGSALALLALLPGALGRLAAALADRVTPLAVRKLLTLLLGASVGSLALPPAPVSSAGTSPVAALKPGEAAGGPDASALPGPGFLPSAAPDLRRANPAAVAAPFGPGFAPTTEAPTTRPATTDTGRRPALSPGFRPSAPVRVADGDRGRLLAPSPRPSSVSHSLITVRRGDTLWSIARTHLGPDASDADVARAWPRWYAANRETIGADPDLLVPGLQLVPPGPADPTATPTSPTTRHLVPKER